MFVDFRKAFDSVLHQALFLKLKNNGISRLFYNIIKSMYTDNILRVILGNKITSEFHSNTGVRQGDTLSPNRFKIFIYDLVDILDDTCDSVSLENFELNFFNVC